jgi:hypothetical protein
MSYLTAVDQTVLRAIATGFCSGTLAGCLDVGLSRWLKKTSWSWDVAITNIVLQAVIYALVIGGGAFVFAILNPFTPLQKIDRTVFKLGVVVSCIPAINLLIEQFDKRLSKSDD